MITNEVGLFGAAALIAGLPAVHGTAASRPRLLAHDGFSKLLAAGLTAVFALQVFVIVGGVTRVIPLTGVTLPFVSYGGSSIVANMVLLALLLIVSDRARATAPAERGGGRVNRQIAQLFGVVLVLFAVLVGFTSRWTVFEAKSLQNDAAQPPPAARAAADPARLIFADDGTELAVQHAARARGQTQRYSRVYPTNGLFAHAVGYSFISNGSAGLEK